MLNKNLKQLRKSRGLSQEELAIRLNVVRQTISKWEKGISVPDADMLIKIADIFEVNVSELLGAKIEEKKEQDVNSLADQLMRINEQLAIKNRRSHRVWKTIGIVLLLFVIFNVGLVVLNYAAFDTYENNTSVQVENVEE
ncbi:helix-turn-helix domain-containing protein [Intestinibacter sp.]|uniref:helix-turn-helix domain-containing protein n=1 Tax=Intestinibacter sp. TaxID=1965304 RepID=UPI002A91355F|nr:helix-turn-helix domain-containing protein [Intestinibacter sp.]MDY5213578.1 helix-turn-helix domain-containing protein [Intestinibacter sp.]